MRPPPSPVAILMVLALGFGAAQAGAAEPADEASLPARAESRVAYGDGPERVLDAYLPAAGPDDAHPVVVLVHGGAWRGGSRLHVAREAAVLAASGYAAFAIDYRLEIDHPFPGQVEDVRRAVAWVRANAGRYRVDPHRVALMGFSAGGNLAMLAGPDLGAAAVVSWSGPMDLRTMATDGRPRAGCRPAAGDRPGTCELPAQVVASLGAIVGCPIDASVPWQGVGPRPAPCPDLYELGSPLLHVAPGDPPTLLAHAVSDPLVPVEGAEATVGALRAAGLPVELVRVPGESHAHQLHGVAMAPTLAFLAAHTGAPSFTERLVATAGTWWR